jgi:murein DD-endopeptidase MepM/ murein hydrolase activator NlpD
VSKKIKNLVNLRIENEEQLSSFIDKIVSEDIGKFKSWSSGRSRRRRKTSEEIEDGIIEGEKFTVKGVTFQSMPSKLGATRAMQLYDSCGGCGDKTPGPDGKDLIGTIIYDKVKPGSSSKYAPRLGTPRESFWSSWYFGAAYGEDPAYHKVWSNRGIGYPAKKAFKIRNDVFQNPTKYKGSAFYMLFHIKEAPIFPGDAIFHWRAESSGKGFGDIGGGGPSHMKIMGTDGNFYGGNEGHSYGKPGARKDRTTGSTVGKSSFNLDNQRRLAPGQPGTDPYMAVLKKVVIADNAPGATQDGQTNKPPEQTNESLKEDRKIIKSDSSLPWASWLAKSNAPSWLKDATDTIINVSDPNDMLQWTNSAHGQDGSTKKAVDLGLRTVSLIPIIGRGGTTIKAFNFAAKGGAKGQAVVGATKNFLGTTNSFLQATKNLKPVLDRLNPKLYSMLAPKMKKLDDMGILWKIHVAGYLVGEGQVKVLQAAIEKYDLDLTKTDDIKKLANILMNTNSGKSMASSAPMITKTIKKKITSKKINEDIGSFIDDTSSTSKATTEKKPEAHISGNFVSNIPPGTVLAHPIGKLPDSQNKWPAGKTWRRTSPAGPRTIDGKAGVHNANDFGCKVGTPICAYADGVVISSAHASCGGKYITISHNLTWSDSDGATGKVKTQYLHLSQQHVNVNSNVKAGQIIGLSGNTGTCTTGPHLHFTFKIGDSQSSNQALYEKNLDNLPQMNCQDMSGVTPKTPETGKEMSETTFARIDKELILSDIIKRSL